jgi:hypothetical protein
MVDYFASNGLPYLQSCKCASKALRAMTSIIAILYIGGFNPSLMFLMFTVPFWDPQLCMIEYDNIQLKLCRCDILDHSCLLYGRM